MTFTVQYNEDFGCFAKNLIVFAKYPQKSKT